MRIPRLYLDQLITPGQSLQLTADRAHYLLKVLRLESGRSLILFNGDGQDYACQVQATHKKTLDVWVESATERVSESPLTLHLAQVISKGERMEFTLQKAVELGVTEITPLFSERSDVKLSKERLLKKHQHWQQILHSACEQSGRARTVPLNRAMALPDFLRWMTAKTNAAEAQTPESCLRFILSPTGAHSSLSALKSCRNALLLVGPEGGFAPEEVTAAQQFGFQGLTLGPRILRTETAALVALSILQHRFGDL